MHMLAYPTSDRQFILYEALRKGATIEELYQLTKIKHWFLEQMLELVQEEEALLKIKGAVPAEDTLRQAKLDGFSVDIQAGRLIRAKKLQVYVLSLKG